MLINVLCNSELNAIHETVYGTFSCVTLSEYVFTHMHARHIHTHTHRNASPSVAAWVGCSITMRDAQVMHPGSSATNVGAPTRAGQASTTTWPVHMSVMQLMKSR